MLKHFWSSLFQEIPYRSIQREQGLCWFCERPRQVGLNNVQLSNLLGGGSVVVYHSKWLRIGRKWKPNEGTGWKGGTGVVVAEPKWCLIKQPQPLQHMQHFFWHRHSFPLCSISQTRTHTFPTQGKRSHVPGPGSQGINMSIFLQYTFPPKDLGVGTYKTI